MGQVTRLHRQEPVRLDSERLCALYDHLGSQQAEALIARAVEDIALHLYHAQSAYHAGQRDGIIRSANAVAFVAAQVGLLTLERIAGNLRECAQHGDPVALGATFARLLRSGERALDFVWEMQAPGS